MIAGRWSSLVLYILALLCVFVADVLAFRTGFYRRYLEPDSYAGQVEQMLLRAHTAKGQVHRVIVLGDSRIAEGFSAKTAGAQFINAAVPGSTPRCWYYFLRWMDPQILRGSLVVIPLDDYADEDGIWDWADRGLDNSLVAARLSLLELPEYVSSFRTFRPATGAALTGLFRGSALRQDLQAFLSAPARRIEKAAAFQAHGHEWSNDYTGNPADLRGLQVDWRNRRITFPPALPAAKREELQTAVFRARVEQTGRYKEYRLRWFRMIAQLLRKNDARLVFVRVPRLPVPLPSSLSGETAVAHLIRHSMATAAPEDQFAEIERPEYFFDALHLNSAGRLAFTSRLVEYLKPLYAGKGPR